MIRVKCKKCGKEFEYPDVYGIPLPANPRCPKCGTPVGTNIINGTMREIYQAANDARKSLSKEISIIFFGEKGEKK